MRPGGGERYSRKDLDGLTEYVGGIGRQGPGLAQGRGRGLGRPDRQVLPAGGPAKLRERFDAKPGDLILIVADTQAVTSQALSNLRARLAAELKLYDPKSFHYSWVVRFPLLAWDAEEGRYVAEHHPFTMPMFEDLHLLDTDPAKVRAQAYDLVINGEEGGGGTIRCHDPADPVQDLRAAGHDARGGRGEVRLPARVPCATVRRPTAASRWGSTGW